MTESESGATGGEVSGFSGDSTRRILRDACTEAGLNPDGAVLLRLGENALYRLRFDPIVVRIARTLDYWQQVQTEVSVAVWLEQEVFFPAARVANYISQPIRVGGHPVTFWKLIPGEDADAGYVSALARLLRRFHGLPLPERFALPETNFYDRVAKRLALSPVSGRDKSYLSDKFEELCGEVGNLKYPLLPSPVHGDAHIKNVMIENGTPILIDFENVGWGQPEWDLSVTATEYASAKFWSRDQYALFAESYGFDVMEWSGFDVMRQIQEIKMTTWLMQNVNESKEIADEFAVRMKTIRTGRSDQPWKPY
ncbi:phosphotransferase family protein [Amycolatopsis sp. CA-126428]|uniref:phosphotransferase family protein n=1 Tax=Amycolatopsis sp. CA-126428 TaxID=2073158 RepID=UPI001304B9D7|nr:aminoglycoside phosphotransferase family protein [Amycolatopsis sp. CA-126428]